MHFGAFGQRQNTAWSGTLSQSGMILHNLITPRGFTGHEHADGLGIIHMNGRIYDPKLGRFLQADPFVQAPKNSQSLNRYSYVLNNPLSYTDPSGYFSLSKFWNKIRPFAAIALSIYMPQFSALWQTLGVAGNAIAIGAITGGVAGFVASGNITGAVAGAFAGTAFGALHGWTPGDTLAKFGKVLAHGAVGGVQNLIQGANFGHGFLAAGFTQSLAGSIGRLSDRFVRVIAAAAVGGTVSEITGGKFANGAVTGAFSRALNEEQFSRQKSNYSITEEQRRLAAEGKVREFWESRQAMGDPVADIALKSLDPSVDIGDYLFGGTSVNNRLQAFARVYTGSELNIDQVRVKLMEAHIDAVTVDRSGVRGLLNPEQIARYHHDVFRDFGLPSTAFGGTPFTGAVAEANWTRPFWCDGCD
jgi:RHS repeat-associated protein